MILLANLLLAAGALVQPSGEGVSAEQKVEILARSVTAASTRPMAIFEDAPVRAEIKRVGLDAGCPIVTDVARATAARFAQTLTPFAEAAVRDTMPTIRLKELHPVSFLVGAAGIYRSRIERKFEDLAAEPLAEARTEARHAVITGLAGLPDFVPTSETAPPIAPIFEGAFGARAEETWDSPPLLTLACLQRAGLSGGHITVEHAGERYEVGGGAQ
jgi:hypothetical protein